MDLGLDGKTFIVTGGTAGLGLVPPNSAAWPRSCCRPLRPTSPAPAIAIDGGQIKMM
jgi:hypothetical protein